MKNIAIISILSFVLLSACKSGGNEPVVINEFILNGNQTTLLETDYRISSENIYFNSKSLEKFFNLTVKDIVPERQLGLCRDDLCIPIEVNPDDIHTAFKENDTYYIPIVKILENLGEEVSWNAEELNLTVTMKDKKGGLMPSKQHK